MSPHARHSNFEPSRVSHVHWPGHNGKKRPKIEFVATAFPPFRLNRMVRGAHSFSFSTFPPLSLSAPIKFPQIFYSIRVEVWSMSTQAQIKWKCQHYSVLLLHLIRQNPLSRQPHLNPVTPTPPARRPHLLSFALSLCLFHLTPTHSSFACLQVSRFDRISKAK